MAGLGSPFTPFPAPAAPNTKAGNVGGFLEALLGGIHQANENREDNELKKAQIEAFKQQQAKAQLDQITRIAQSSPDKQQDPNLIAQAKRLAKAAGLPEPTTFTSGIAGGNLSTNGEGAGSSIDTSGKTPMVGGSYQGTDFGTPQIQRETLDMNVLAPKADIHSLPEADQQKIFSLPPGPVRDRALESYSGVTTLDRQAPAIVSPADKTQIYKQLGEITTNIGKGIYTGRVGSELLHTIANQAAAAGMDVSELADFIQQDAATGPATQAKIAQFNALNSNERAQAAYRKMLTVDKPQWMIQQLKQGQQRADAATTNAASGTTRAQAAVTSAQASEDRAQAAITNANTNASTAMIKANAAAESADARVSEAQAAINRNDIDAARLNQTKLQTTVAQLNSQYKTISDLIGKLVAAGGDPSDGGDQSLLAQQKKIKDSLDTATNTLSTNKDFVVGHVNKVAQRATGNPTAKVGDQLYKPGSAVPNEEGYKFTGQRGPQDSYQAIGPDGQIRYWSPKV